MLYQEPEMDVVEFWQTNVICGESGSVTGGTTLPDGSEPEADGSGEW